MEPSDSGWILCGLTSRWARRLFTLTYRPLKSVRQMNADFENQLSSKLGPAPRFGLFGSFAKSEDWLPHMILCLGALKPMAVKPWESKLVSRAQVVRGQVCGELRLGGAKKETAKNEKIEEMKDIIDITHQKILYKKNKSSKHRKELRTLHEATKNHRVYHLLVDALSTGKSIRMVSPCSTTPSTLRR